MINYSPLSKSGKSMDFGQAIYYLKEGYRVARKGWNGKGMFLLLVKGSRPTITEGSAYFKSAGLRGNATIKPHIDICTAKGEMQPGWVPSQEDMLSGDWELVI